MGKGMLALVLVACAVAQAGQPADVTARSADGSTPLLLAAYAGDTARVAELLKAGADARVPNRYGASPMGEAPRSCGCCSRPAPIRNPPIRKARRR